MVDNPPYSPDLVPTDYHLFPNLKKHLAKHEKKKWPSTHCKVSCIRKIRRRASSYRNHIKGQACSSSDLVKKSNLCQNGKWKCDDDDINHDKLIPEENGYSLQIKLNRVLNLNISKSISPSFTCFRGPTKKNHSHYLSCSKSVILNQPGSIWPLGVYVIFLCEGGGSH